MYILPLHPLFDPCLFTLPSVCPSSFHLVEILDCIFFRVAPLRFAGRQRAMTILSGAGLTGIGLHATGGVEQKRAEKEGTLVVSTLL